MKRLQSVKIIYAKYKVVCIFPKKSDIKTPLRQLDKGFHLGHGSAVRLPSFSSAEFQQGSASNRNHSTPVQVK